MTSKAKVYRHLFAPLAPALCIKLMRHSGLVCFSLNWFYTFLP